MRITGYCKSCRKVKLVNVTGYALAMARGGVVQGICASCEDKDRERGG